ncbi:MAG: type II toxin-antitoxin system Phd/YefM family antitoxin [Methanosarcinales archaeon]|jgi:prevent-host-death family protein|nr:type II toxin-antitoxin system Phd/YefM family antitoxin [Methanosarcinales archaeon]
MMQIRPVSDLRNKFTEIELIIKEGAPVYLTKNGHGAAVVLSLEKYSELTEDIDYIERMLDEADRSAEESDVRYTHEEVFSRLRDKYA